MRAVARAVAPDRAAQLHPHAVARVEQCPLDLGVGQTRGKRSKDPQFVLPEDDSSLAEGLDLDLAIANRNRNRLGNRLGTQDEPRRCERARDLCPRAANERGTLGRPVPRGRQAKVAPFRGRQAAAHTAKALLAPRPGPSALLDDTHSCNCVQILRNERGDPEIGDKVVWNRLRRVTLARPATLKVATPPDRVDQGED